MKALKATGILLLYALGFIIFMLVFVQVLESIHQNFGDRWSGGFFILVVFVLPILAIIWSDIYDSL